MPQFGTGSSALAVLGAVYAGVTLLYLAAVGIATDTAGELLAGHAELLRRVTGVVLVGFGLALAVEPL